MTLYLVRYDIIVCSNFSVPAVLVGARLYAHTFAIYMLNASVEKFEILLSLEESTNGEVRKTKTDHKI